MTWTIRLDSCVLSSFRTLWRHYATAGDAEVGDEAPLDTVAMSWFCSKRHSVDGRSRASGRLRRGWTAEQGSVSSSRRHSTARQWLYRFPHLSALPARGVADSDDVNLAPAAAAVAETQIRRRRAVLDCHYQISVNAIRERASGITDSVTALTEKWKTTDTTETTSWFAHWQTELGDDNLLFIKRWELQCIDICMVTDHAYVHRQRTVLLN